MAGCARIGEGLRARIFQTLYLRRIKPPTGRSIFHRAEISLLLGRSAKCALGLDLGGDIHFLTSASALVTESLLTLDTHKIDHTRTPILEIGHVNRSRCTGRSKVNLGIMRKKIKERIAMAMISAAIRVRKSRYFSLELNI